jgi:hypothetical protein
MPTCLTDNQIFHIFADNQHIGQVKISFGQPVLNLHLPNGLVVQKANVEPCIFDVIRDGCPTGSKDISKFHPWYLCSCSCSCPQMIRLDDAVMIALVRSSPPTSRTRLLPHGSSHAPTYRSIRAFHKDPCSADSTGVKLH